MKKVVFWLAAAAAVLTVVSCEKEEGDDPVTCPDEPAEFLVLTFEDADYLGGGASYWSSLIDDPEYGGPLLYDGDPMAWDAEVEYEWTDTGNTWLSSGTFVDYGFTYSFGGAAISDYVLADETGADYTRQLSLWSTAPRGAAGHNGSANYCIVYTGMGMGLYPALTFADGSERIIDHLWIAHTAYTANSLLHSEYEKAGPDDWFGVRATGYDAADEETGSVEIYLFRDGEILRDWTKWELAGLGRVAYVEFECIGSIENAYGLATPAYFAIDDVAVAIDADAEE